MYLKQKVNASKVGGVAPMVGNINSERINNNLFVTSLKN
jgi:hypothetical protein